LWGGPRPPAPPPAGRRGRGPGGVRWSGFLLVLGGLRVRRFAGGGPRSGFACRFASPSGRCCAALVVALGLGWWSLPPGGAWWWSVGPSPSSPAVRRWRLGRRSGLGSAARPARRAARGCPVSAFLSFWRCSRALGSLGLAVSPVARGALLCCVPVGGARRFLALAAARRLARWLGLSAWPVRFPAAGGGFAFGVVVASPLFSSAGLSRWRGRFCVAWAG